MDAGVRLIHCLSACLTGIVMVSLAIVICAVNGSAGGVLLGFCSLVAGYIASVAAVGTKQRISDGAIYTVLICWALGLSAIIAAIAAVS